MLSTLFLIQLFNIKQDVMSYDLDILTLKVYMMLVALLEDGVAEGMQQMSNQLLFTQHLLCPLH